MAIQTTRMQQLRKLAQATPVANQQVARGLQEAQATQLQAAIGAAKPGAGVQQAQQLGAATAGQQAATQMQAAQDTQKQLQRACLS